MGLVLTAHQGTLFPWPGLLAKVAAADAFCLFDVGGVESSGFENRVQVKTANGPQWITVPVKRHRDSTQANLEIAREHDWQRKVWRTLELAYAKAPFWGAYAQTIHQLVHGKEQFLADYNEQALAVMLAWFGIYPNKWFRASRLPVEGQKSDLVLSMCKTVGATEYLFGKLGADYCNRSAFKAAGIKVRFQDYQCVPYKQLHGDFVPGLSALDLLLNVGPEKGREVILAGNGWTE